jgi:hypothetical protein
LVHFSATLKNELPMLLSSKAASKRIETTRHDTLPLPRRFHSLSTARVVLFRMVQGERQYHPYQSNIRRPLFAAISHCRKIFDEDRKQDAYARVCPPIRALSRFSTAKRQVIRGSKGFALLEDRSTDTTVVTGIRAKSKHAVPRQPKPWGVNDYFGMLKLSELRRPSSSARRAG